MANVTWTSSSGGNCDTTTSWTGLTGGETFPGQSIADAVTLSNKNNNSQYTLTLQCGDCEHRQPGHGGWHWGEQSGDPLKMTAGVGNTLIDSGGITLNNAQAQINGAGTISVGGQISGIGTIAAGVGVKRRHPQPDGCGIDCQRRGARHQQVRRNHVTARPCRWGRLPLPRSPSTAQTATR